MRKKFGRKIHFIEIFRIAPIGAAIQRDSSVKAKTNTYRKRVIMNAKKSILNLTSNNILTFKGKNKNEKYSLQQNYTGSIHLGPSGSGVRLAV